jgi:hypothetical protein
MLMRVTEDWAADSSYHNTTQLTGTENLSHQLCQSFEFSPNLHESHGERVVNVRLADLVPTAGFSHLQAQHQGHRNVLLQ